MKKKYIKPHIVAIKIEAQNILASSFNAETSSSEELKYGGNASDIDNDEDFTIINAYGKGFME